MKKYFVYILLCAFIISGCSSSKQKINKVEPQMTKLADKGVQNTGESKKTAQKSAQSKDEDKDKKKQNDKKIKEEKAKNKQAEKEAAKKKKQAEKEAKRKKKEQEDLIRNAVKDEKKRIEEERRKEKEELLSNLSESKKETASQTDKTASQVEKTAEKFAAAAKENNSDTTIKAIEDILGGETVQDVQIVKDTQEENTEEDYVPKFLKKAKKKKSAQTEVQPQDTVQAKPLTTMDKILAMMDGKQIDEQTGGIINPNGEVVDAEGKVIGKVDDAKTKKTKEKKDNFIQREWKEAFPEHIDRDITYDKMYKEQPRSILILYPWNRSQYNNADEMLYATAAKELGMKGYYVFPIIPLTEEYKQNNDFSSQNTKIQDLKNIKEQYGADAVMFVTIYRFDNPYWSTATKAVAHYTLVSTSTLDTLFARQVEFNYDTPIPPKDSHNKDLELDEEQIYDLGVMQQMQAYAFMDIPFGPYHKKYQKDRKRFSNKQEVKYKINVRPS